MNPTKAPTPFRGFNPDHLYLTDNGACYCGEHLGMSAKYTRRDISGQPIERVTRDMVEEEWAEGETPRSWEPECERCGKRVP